ncbi:hypothetical protein [Vibrio metschnikovii]|uniref:Uncharacterized protein n=1 Tax=Vibrio metschnikovii TaxID=28172 RepID=A0A9X0RA84_VIBME|nr:hypothetical protein [Vibrio metschnikovii]MBC5851291.1 hypothetical protein [Vibrio metschnikovii]
MKEKLNSASRYLNPGLVNRLMSSNIEATVLNDCTVLVCGSEFSLSENSTFKQGDVLIVSLEKDIVAELKSEKEAQKELRVREAEEAKAKIKKESCKYISEEKLIIDGFISNSPSTKDILEIFESKLETFRVKTKLCNNSRASGIDYDLKYALMRASKEVVEYLLERVIKINPEDFEKYYAYSPNENVDSGGKYHLALTKPLKIGRLKRESGQIICSPNKEFWGLDLRDDKEINLAVCKKCLETAIKLSGWN